ncbi:hypothetical protein NPX13_g5412 [Xylaria arbuscula]|uniref:Uncharacterized protein n=1 Tax=Xylaria arbuscula TaxID=114810 RepID=A0A9W8TLB0_9PEZI|nr:hypothetical protein NPX13_g5412 [Xylaria arbuscula]
MSKQRYQIEIVIFRAEPLYYQKKRHTAIHMISEKGEHFMYHIRGSQRDFSFEARRGYNPTESNTFAKRIPIEWLAHPLAAAEMGTILSNVPIDNRGDGYNCQQWVGDALDHLVAEKLLSRKAVDGAIDGMVDAIMDAKDEP